MTHCLPVLWDTPSTLSTACNLKARSHQAAVGMTVPNGVIGSMLTSAACSQQSSALQGSPLYAARFLKTSSHRRRVASMPQYLQVQQYPSHTTNPVDSLALQAAACPKACRCSSLPQCLQVQQHGSTRITCVKLMLQVAA